MTRYAVEAPARPISRIITPYSFESIGPSNGPASQASAAWPSANLALYVPFQVPPRTTFVAARAFIANGATVNGNVDVGVYDESFVKLLSTGAIAHSGSANLQDLGAFDLTLMPGRYYLAISMSSGTASLFMTNSWGGGVLASFGVAQQASAHPLPSTATPVACAQTALPMFGISSQAVF